MPYCCVGETALVVGSGASLTISGVPVAVIGVPVAFTGEPTWTPFDRKQKAMNQRRSGRHRGTRQE